MRSSQSSPPAEPGPATDGSEADVVEQLTPGGPDYDEFDDLPDGRIDRRVGGGADDPVIGEADPADVLDQHRIVPIDDEDR